MLLLKATVTQILNNVSASTTP